MYKKPFTNTEEECPAASYKTAVNLGLRIYQKIADAQMEQGVGAEKFTPLDFDDCSLEGLFQILLVKSGSSYY